LFEEDFFNFWLSDPIDDFLIGEVKEESIAGESVDKVDFVVFWAITVFYFVQDAVSFAG
jgi:hypothetical protein